MTPGRFVVLEGADGGGKTTQVELLAGRLRQAGHEVVTTREPGGTPAGIAIRSVVLEGGGIDPRTEALLVAADRAEHMAVVVGPALARGVVVVSDRHVPSSLAYQGVARGLGVDAVARLSRWATGGIEPDLVVVLDVDPDVARLRRAGPEDRMEREGGTFQAAVRRAYLDLAGQFGWTVVDGARPPEVVAEDIWALVRDRLGLG